MTIYHKDVFLLSFLFCLSGCSALMYQIMWQRMLFTLFGVDLESVTLIVSVFMFGLGVGGLLGGFVADAVSHAKLVRFYVFIETGVAILGFLSSSIILALGETVSSSSPWMTAASSFGILAFPTILMGATFPLLVTYVNQHNQTIGQSVGLLYFVNTLGAALGAYLSGFWLLNFMEIHSVINIAASLNLIAAGTALLAWRK